jgi:DNA polymerase I-like protein with 3'-5' exonuclease and polymerase domains
MFLRNLGVRIALQYHDEVLFNVRKGQEERTKQLIDKSIEMVNERLKLNITVACSVQFGSDYADCH